MAWDANWVLDDPSDEASAAAFLRQLADIRRHEGGNTTDSSFEASKSLTPTYQGEGQAARYRSPQKRRMTV